MGLLNRLVGTSTTNEQRYECSCGVPMANTHAHSTDQYRVETWECTHPDDDCLQVGKASIVDDPSESYGDGPLTGHVEGREL